MTHQPGSKQTIKPGCGIGDEGGSHLSHNPETDRNDAKSKARDVARPIDAIMKVDIDPMNCTRLTHAAAALRFKFLHRNRTPHKHGLSCADAAENIKLGHRGLSNGSNAMQSPKCDGAGTHNQLAVRDGFGQQTGRQKPSFSFTAYVGTWASMRRSDMPAGSDVTCRGSRGDSLDLKDRSNSRPRQIAPRSPDKRGDQAILKNEKAFMTEWISVPRASHGARSECTLRDDNGTIEGDIPALQYKSLPF